MVFYARATDEAAALALSAGRIKATNFIRVSSVHICGGYDSPFNLWIIRRFRMCGLLSARW